MSIKRNLLAAAALALASPAAAADIVETASSNGSFTTLVAAVKAAGLVDTLKGTGPFTVFAPTDEAFKLPAGTVENLLKPENKAQLTKVLTYPVVPGKVMASDVKGKGPPARRIPGPDEHRPHIGDLASNGPFSLQPTGCLLRRSAAGLVAGEPPTTAARRWRQGPDRFENAPARAKPL